MSSQSDTAEITFAQAEKVNPYELARRWADGTSRLSDPTVNSELEELAMMEALHSWLGRWRGTQIHRALVAGASVEQVAQALGYPDPAGAVRIWRVYDQGQRGLWKHYPELARTEDHDQVEQVVKSWEETH